MRFTLHKWSIETTTTTKNRFQTSLRFCFRSLFFSKTKNIFTSAILYFFGEKCSCWSMQQKKRPETYRFRLFALVLATNTWNGNFFFPFLSSEKLFLSTHPPDVYDSRWIDPKKEHSHNCTAFAQQMLSHEMNYKFIIKWIHAGVLSVYFLTPSQIHRIHRLCLRTISIHICVYMCSSAWNEFARDLLECS